MARDMEQRWWVREHPLGNGRKLYLTLDLNEVEQIDEARRRYASLLDHVRELGANVVYEKAFGLASVEPLLRPVREHQGARWPVSHVEGQPTSGAALSSVTIAATLDAPVDYASPRLAAAREGATRRGYGFGILAPDFTTLFERIARELACGGFAAADLLRTWFYLRDIDADYESFNRARREFFEAQGIDYSAGAETLPASTCIAGCAGVESVAAADFVSVAGGRAERRRLRTSLQPEAEGERYPMAPTFSRAVLWSDPAYRELQISGTASVDASGRTAHPGDARAQIRATLGTVQTLLEQAALSFDDVCQATCFFRHAEHRGLFSEVASELGLPPFAHTFVVGKVCRPDLLFELDAVAVGASSAR